MGHLVNVSLPTTICLTLVYSSTVKAKLFVPLHTHSIWPDIASDMRFGERRETSCSSMWEGIGHGDLPLTGGVDAGEAGREGKQ